MDIQPIIEVIKANQHLSYDEVKKQAIEVGLSAEQLEEAWREAKLDPSVDNDRRVAEIEDEIRLRKRETKTLDEWKEYFKQKGYLDDEVDVAYVLTDVNIKSNPFSSWYEPVIIVGLITVFAVSFSPLPGIPIVLEAVMTALFTYGVLYLILFFSQFQNYSLNIIRLDFNAKPSLPLPEWKQGGSKLLDYPEANITSLFEMVYDGRQTFYGEYHYTVGSGKHRHTYFYSFIAQKAHKELPLVHLFAPQMDRSFLKKEVQLEGKEFNKAYNIYAKNPRDAFYVFNPRLMTALLKLEVVKELKSFETVGNYIIMSFTNLNLSTPTRYKKPYVRFADYESLKSKMLHRLDLASDINDTLSRLIVDDGDNRSVAKQK